MWVPVSITTVVCLKLRPAASNSFRHMSPTRCPGSSGPRCSRRAGVRTICSPWPLVSVEWELCSGITTIATELSLTLLSLIDFQLAESGGSLQSDGGSRIFHHHFCDCVAYFSPQQRLCPAGCKSDIFFTDPIFYFFFSFDFFFRRSLVSISVLILSKYINITKSYNSFVLKSLNLFWLKVVS